MDGGFIRLKLCEISSAILGARTLVLLMMVGEGEGGFNKEGTGEGREGKDGLYRRFPPPTWPACWAADVGICIRDESISGGAAGVGGNIGEGWAWGVKP